MSADLTDLVDDPEAIPDSTILYRRVSWQLAGGRGRCAAGELCRMHRNFFSDQTEERAREFGLARRCMSVGVDAVLRRYGHEPEHLLEQWPGYGLVSMTAGELRNLKKANGDPMPQGVMPHPTPTEPWHAVVFMLDGSVRPNSGQSAIASLAKWVVELRG